MRSSKVVYHEPATQKREHDPAAIDPVAGSGNVLIFISPISHSIWNKQMSKKIIIILTDVIPAEAAMKRLKLLSMNQPAANVSSFGAPINNIPSLAVC